MFYTLVQGFSNRLIGCVIPPERQGERSRQLGQAAPPLQHQVNDREVSQLVALPMMKVLVLTCGTVSHAEAEQVLLFVFLQAPPPCLGWAAWQQYLCDLCLAAQETWKGNLSSNFGLTVKVASFSTI